MKKRSKRKQREFEYAFGKRGENRPMDPKQNPNLAFEYSDYGRNANLVRHRFVSIDAMYEDATYADSAISDYVQGIPKTLRAEIAQALIDSRKRRKKDLSKKDVDRFFRSLRRYDIEIETAIRERIDELRQRVSDLEGCL